MNQRSCHEAKNDGDCLASTPDRVPSSARRRSRIQRASPLMTGGGALMLPTAAGPSAGETGGCGALPLSTAAAAGEAGAIAAAATADMGAESGDAGAAVAAGTEAHDNGRRIEGGGLGGGLGGGDSSASSSPSELTAKREC